MTNVENEMTKEFRIPNVERNIKNNAPKRVLSFVILISTFDILSSF